MTRGERVHCIITAGLVTAIFILSTHQATVEEEVASLRPVTTLATTTTTTTDPLAVELLRTKQEIAELRANRGLTGPEVRALVETLLPAETCPEPPCPPVTAPSAASTTTPSSTTTERRRRR